MWPGVFLRLCDIFFQPNSGCSAAFNAGVEKAEGNYLSFLGSDDSWTEKKLKLQMAVLHSTPEIDMVFGHIGHYFSPDLEQRKRSRFKCPGEKMPGYHAGTMLIRKEAFLRVGLFDANYQTGEFLDWYFRAKEKGLREVLLPDVVMKRRIHSSNLGIVKRDTQTEDYIRVLKASLDRRRRNSSQFQMSR